MDVTIEHLGPKGDGIFRSPRGPVFVDRALPGDRIRTRISRIGPVARGEILEILEPSPLRHPAPCPHYDRCGGCTVQHLTPDAYRKWKVDIVREALLRQRIKPMRWGIPVFLGGQNRRRATFSVSKRRGKMTMGYYRRRSQEISDIDTCLIADPRLLSLREQVRPLLAPLVEEGSRIDVFFQLIEDKVDMVITGEMDLDALRARAASLRQVGISRLSWRRSERNKPKLVFNGSIVAHFGLLKASVPPAAFLQPTLEGEVALVEAVLKSLPPTGEFVDLFAGCGTFSGPMSTRGPVDAYELDPASVRALNRAGQQNVRAQQRDLFENPLRREEINRYDAAVFDPPRCGCPEQAAAMASARTSTLIGVSCNPATFARDARILCDGGYRLQNVQMIDQFLWSHHVEIVGTFSKR